ncbi:MAG TPA: YceI family protein [Candidatus Angelobacter sp.]|nr:YceI family protein [Candidatus Angelobacter sp.]
MRIRKFLVLSLAVAAMGASALAADEYKIDPVHSTVGFNVKHMMVSTVHGRFNDFSGQILYDDKDPSKSSVKVTIKAASINTDNTGRDTDLRSPNFLDVDKFPEITFQSKSVEKKGDAYVAHGTLTIHGVAKDVDLPFSLNGPLTTPRGKVLGADAGLTINRMDYGVSWSRSLDGGGMVVSNDVKIELNVEARTPPPAPPAAK